MKKKKPKTKPQVKNPIELLLGHSLSFSEIIRRIVRVTPQEVKLPKR